jgi:hypothetical protein
LCASVGIEFHELQVGTKFNGLGWDWDCGEGATGTMICPEDKYDGVFELLTSLHGRESLSLHEVERAVGVLNFVSAGFPIGHADVGAMVTFRTMLQAKAKRSGKSPEEVFMRSTDDVRKAVEFWWTLWPSWDRTCPIVGGFSPVRSWQALGFVDASTSWGCGGVLVIGSAAYAFMHEWSEKERADAFVHDRESTGRLEMYGVARWLNVFSAKCTAKRVLLCGDNSAAVRGLDRCYSSNTALYAPLLEARRLCADMHITLRSRYIPTALNTIADALSKGDYDQARCLAQTTFGMDLVLV